MKRISARGWAVAATASAILCVVAVAAKHRSDPAVAWLEERGPARWIVYPYPGDTSARELVELDTSFSRTFHLDEAPAAALLRYRAFRRGVVRINGREAAATAGPDWKAERSADVAGLLRAGENVIEAVVSNAAGPPAAWIALELPGTTIASDEGWTSSWAGAAARPAVRASAPRSVRMLDPERRVMSSLAGLALDWKRILSFAILAALAVAGTARLRRMRPGWPLWAPGSPWPVRLAVAAVALLWTALFVNNSPWLPLGLGFDAPAHLEYAQFILERRAIPFADEGWQMFQPPLYYLLLAAACAAGGVPAAAPEAASAVRGLGLLVGVAHVAVLGACMRLVFPGRPRAQVLGVLIGGLVPCMLYLHHYPANEPLVAMLSSAAVLASLRLLRQDEPRLPGHAVLGLLVGLALLAKVSALLLLPPLLGALAVRALLGERRWRARRLAATAVSAAAVIATCGWYYALVWRRFGTPFVGGWDPRRGMGWWQDPGYRTIHDFLRFGRAFTEPLYAGFNGVWDGLYVTLWGDGLLSGGGTLALVPPWWSPSLMAAALLLAAVPAAAGLAGAAAAAVRWVRAPDATTGVLLGLAFLVVLAVLSMVVAVPAIGADKASYGLMALVPLCAFAARALDAGGRGAWRSHVLAVAVGAWALTSFATYWIDASSGKARLVMGVAEMDRGDRARGLALVRDAQARAPDDWSARVALAGYLLEPGRPRPQVVSLLAPDDPLPELAERHVALAVLASQQGDAARAERALARAVAKDPDNLQAHLQLAALAAGSGDYARAVASAREVLRIDPQYETSHVALAELYGRLGDAQRAAMHQAYAARIRRAR